VLPDPPVVTSGTSSGNPEGQWFSYQIVANGSPTSYGANNLPPGLSCDPVTGIISGTPIASGSSVVSITASNAGGTGTATLTISVFSSAPAITGGTSAAGVLNLPFSDQISATNFPANYTVSSLPAGLVLNHATGLISGTATVTGTFASTVSAGNLTGSGSAALSIVIAASPVPVTAFNFYSSPEAAIGGASGFYSSSGGNEFDVYQESVGGETTERAIVPDGNVWDASFVQPAGKLP